MRQSHTTVLERNTVWRGPFATEPYEVGWAREAVFFVRVLETDVLNQWPQAWVEISPDGIQWCREGETLMLPDGADLPEQDLSFCRVEHFGSWLRLAGELPPDTFMRVIVYLVLKE